MKTPESATRTVKLDAGADDGDRREIFDEHLVAVEHLTAERAAADRSVVVQNVDRVLSWFTRKHNSGYSSGRVA